MTATIAVVGGSPADTRLGAAFLRGLLEGETAGGLGLIEHAVSPSPHAQTLFQNMDFEHKQKQMRSLLEDLKERGADGVFVYCNSLSGATDLPALADDLGLALVTPLHAYRVWALDYAALGVFAANASGLGGIERTLYAANPDIKLLQFGHLALVDAIEEGLPLDLVLRRFRLPELVALFADLGAEAIILGCTHFPAFRAELLPQSRVPLLDPAQEMWRQLELMLS